MKIRSHQIKSSSPAQSGAIMAVVLITVLVVSLCGIGLLQLASSSAVDNTKHLVRTRAFWALEAGLQYVTAHARSNRDEAVEFAFPTPLPTWTQTIARTTLAVGPVSQTNQSFEVRAHLMQPAGIRKDLQTTLAQIHALPFALFGADRLSISGTIAGYNSAIHLDPMASPTSVTSGYQNQFGYFGPPDSALHTSEYVPDGDPDALGIFPVGPLAKVFDGPIFWTAEFVDVTETNDVHYHGPVNRFFSSVSWNSTSAVIQVDVSGGMVNFFLSGGLTTATGVQLVITNGPPSRFRIFAAGGVGERIQMDLAGDGGGLIYATEMEIDIQCQGNFLGGAWGRDVRIQANTVYLDVDLFDYSTFLFPTLSTYVYRIAPSAWRQVPP